MKIVLFVLLFAALLLLTALFIPVKIEFAFEKNQGEKPVTKLTMHTLGGLVKIKIPNFMNKKNRSKGKRSAKKNKAENSEKKFADRIDELSIVLKRLRQTYSGSRSFVRKRLIAQKLNISIMLGLFDAAQTGIAIGAVWSLIYGFFAWFTQIAIVKEHIFTVEPVYDRAMYKFKIEGIINAKLVNIINMAFIIFINYRKTRDNNTTNKKGRCTDG